MRLAMTGQTDDEFLAFARQLGATDILSVRELPTDKGYYGFQDLLFLRKRIEDAGLRCAARSLPANWSNKIKLGLPGRDEQIDNWCKTLRNMGAAGIPVLYYTFTLRSAGGYGLRTSRTTPGRGGARVTSFDYDLIKGATQDYWDPPVADSVETTDEQMWDHVTYFLQAVIPVAEQAGVRMALHPDDPPISPIAGVARIFRSHAALQRLIEIVPSDSNGLNFCQGTVSEMPENVLDAIRYFGSRDKIFYVHFRNVTGPVPQFAETFIDEGHVNMLEAMRAYKEVGFDGPMVDD
ncbi:MAG: mannonate dehydratase, partial [Dehalococcoidia bacterium]|nr:mannonate dehydratase [Dehalococcoidia bacterium]